MTNYKTGLPYKRYEKPSLHTLDCPVSYTHLIRYHEGTFYIINTFVSEGREARRDNYIITATNPAGPWSDPVFVEGADGIDSSLFFDDDGSIWYAGNFISEENLYEGHHGIYLNELDPVTFQFKGPRYIIWDGKKTYSHWIEAPHIYKKDGWYYLMVADVYKRQLTNSIS